MSARTNTDDSLINEAKRKLSAKMSNRDTLMALGREAIADPERFNRQVQPYLPPSNDARYFDCNTERGVFATQMVICLAWAQGGFQSIVLPHKFAAALMATDIDPDAIFPWPAFEIRVPDGLIVAGGEKMVSIIVAENDPKTALFFTVVYEKTESIFAGDRRLMMTMDATKLEEEDAVYGDDRDHQSGEFARAMILAKRLVMNVCTALNSHKAPDAKRKSEFSVRTRQPKHEPTTVHEFTTGAPLRIDCTHGIRDYVSGAARTSPKVTTLVRGHWRNQAYGPGWASHKQMWIQPFYRGHGPLVHRPVHLGEGK